MREIIPFKKLISPKVNIIARVVFELIYYDVTFQQIASMPEDFSTYIQKLWVDETQIKVIVENSWHRSLPLSSTRKR